MNDYFEELEAEKRHHEVLKRFCLGKWQDTEKVEAALDIDWDEGTKRFKWGRIANWNPYPWNGQYVITKYRLKDSEEPWPDEHWRNIRTDPDREGEYKDDTNINIYSDDDNSRYTFEVCLFNDNKEYIYTNNITKSEDKLKFMLNNKNKTHFLNNG